MLNYSVQVGTTEMPSDEWQGELTTALNPFPGLRPFTIEESHLFFGREGQVDEILSKLAHHRCVAVLGYSGSGKSSLMNCGLVPVLLGGFMTDRGPHWRVVSVRPGNRPIESLTQAVLRHLKEAGKIEEADVQIHRSILTSVLWSSTAGLVEVARFLQDEYDENVFFLFDQFEELFRFRQSGTDEALNEAAHYVNLILEGVHQQEVPLYAALNMRSDFIGECSAFAGLTQMINESNYLVPQMTRDQKRLAIEGPVAVAGGRITQRLVKKILSDTNTHQDQLPILQHALMRTWDYWLANREEGEPLDLRHYNAVGRVTQALSLHANEAYDELNTREREIAEVLFKAITERDIENQGVRRPAKVSTIASLAGAQEAEVIRVADVFRQPGRSFLMPAGSQPLSGESQLELSHESMMRIWNRLSGWVEEEFESAQMYRRISDAAAMYQIGKTGLWRPPDLQLALNWQKKQRPTRLWAQRYDIAFERAIVFLDTSRITYEAELKNQEMLQRRILRRSRITSIILAALLLIAIGFFLYGVTQQMEVEKKAFEAEQAKAEALQALQESEKSKLAAIEAEQKTRAANEELETEKLNLKIAYDSLASQARELEEQRNLAMANEKEARIQRDSALFQKGEAEKNLAKAEASERLAYAQLMLQIAQQLGAKAEGIVDKNLSGLAAMQGYRFHTRYKGRDYDAYIFRGLYYALAKLKGKNYNTFSVSGKLRNRMYSMAVSPSTDRVYVTGNDGRIFAGNFDQPGSARLLASNPFPNRVLAIDPSEKFLALGSDSSFIQLFDLAQPDKLPRKITGHTRFVNDIQFLPDGRSFVSAGGDGAVWLTTVDGASRLLVQLPYALKAIQVSPDASYLMGGSATGELVRIDLKTGAHRLLLNEAPNRILSLAIDPTGTTCAFGVEIIKANKLVERGVVKLMDLQAGRVTKELEGHLSAVVDIAYSPDGKLLASAGLDRKLQMWVVGKEQKDLPILLDISEGNYWSISFARGSDYLVASSNNGEVRYWPTDPKILANQICPLLTRNMTPEEWEIFVQTDNAPYETTCPTLLIDKY